MVFFNLFDEAVVVVSPIFFQQKKMLKKAGRDCFDVAGGISPAAPGTAAELDCCFFWKAPVFKIHCRFNGTLFYDKAYLLERATSSNSYPQQPPPDWSQCTRH